jgi:DNA-binding MarR family transcriptional regulator
MTKATYLSGTLQVKAYRVLQDYVSKEIKKFGINTTQWFILGQISQVKTIRPADIAGMLKVEAPLITSLADDLVNKGLVNKKLDSKDKRVRLLGLTKKGTQLVPKIESNLQTSLGTLLAGLSADELKIYHKVLGTIVSNDQAPV